MTNKNQGETLNTKEVRGRSGSQSLTLRVFSDMESLREIRTQWDDLISVCPETSIFSTWEWLSSWWTAFGTERALMVLAFWDPYENLVALAPLCLVEQRVAGGLKLRTIQLMGDGSGDSDNLGFLVRDQYEESYATALLGYLNTQAAAWDVCEFRTMDPEARATKALQTAVQLQGWSSYSYFHPWMLISLPTDWEAYSKKLSSKERRKLGNLTRRLENRYQVIYHKCVDPAELPAQMETLYELHGKRWSIKGDEGSFVSLERHTFYELMAAQFLERGWLEFWSLKLNGKPVAMIYGFRYRNTVYSLQEGFDPQYSRDSVGYVLRGHVLRQLIAEGVRTYDFLEGQDTSKERWGAHMQSYLCLYFGRKWSKGSAYLRGFHTAGEMKNWIRCSVSPKTLDILHEVNLRVKKLRFPPM